MVRNCFLLILVLIGLFSGAQSSGHTESEAKQLIDSLHTLLVNGADFKELANTYSEDPGTKRKGGIYSNVEMGTFVAEFEAVVQQVKLMEISSPFKTEYGYHILQVIERKEGKFSVRHILIKF